jgi:hypothetical protein
MRSVGCILLLILYLDLYGQRIDIHADYPLPGNSFLGIASANVQYNGHMRSEYTYYGIGTSATLLQNKEGQQLLNLNADIGINRKITVSHSVDLYPYFNMGYARFQYLATANNGLKEEIGVSVCPAGAYNRVGFHLAYRQYFMGTFVFSSKSDAPGGNFGMLLLGLHMHLSTRKS